MIFTPTSFIMIDTLTVQVKAKTPAEAKLALKELKIKKKEYGLLKRELLAKQKEIRVEYSNEVATRGSKFMGGGGVGRLIRGIQTISRDNARAEVANRIAPLEQRSQEIDSVILAIDSAIIQLEGYLLKYS